MDPLRFIDQTQGVFLRREARDCGYDDRAIAAALRAKVWVRVRRGAYTFHDIWSAAHPARRHRILARAVLRSHGDNVALSHVSASLEHDLAVWNVDLDKVHVTRLDGGAGRTERDVVHHEGLCLDNDLVEKDGLLMVRPARAALETASLTTTEAGLVTVDSVLHLGLTDPDELAAAARLMEHWPHTANLRVVVRLADGRAESPGESRSRHLCWATGLPAPQLQFEVYDAWGRLLGVTDFAWPEHRLLGEFDGRVKYERLLRDGETPADAVIREKQREDLLREATLWNMIRLIWADLYRPYETAARIRRLMAAAA